MTTQAIANFRDAEAAAAAALVTVGFELETQSTTVRVASADGTQDAVLQNGSTIPEAPVFLEDAYNAHVDAAIKSYSSDFNSLAVVAPLWPEGHPFRALTSGGKWEFLYKAFGVRSDATVKAFVERGILTAKDFKEYQRAVKDKVVADTPRSQFTRRRTPLEYLRTAAGLPVGTLEVGTDASVRGFEFRTKGGLTTDQFMSTAETLFGLRHSIDANCSFHVHVKVNEVEHVWGERMQQALTEFLVQNIARVPDTVKQRWTATGGDGGRFFQVGIQDAKYSFVHKHPRFNTWEFRCFGNVRNAADAKICMQLAIEAMQHAYKVRAGTERLVADERMWTMDTWRQACSYALARSVTLSSVAERFRSAA